MNRPFESVTIRGDGRWTSSRPSETDAPDSGRPVKASTTTPLMAPVPEVAPACAAGRAGPAGATCGEAPKDVAPARQVIKRLSGRRAERSGIWPPYGEVDVSMVLQVW